MFDRASGHSHPSRTENESISRDQEWLHALDVLLRQLQTLHPGEERETVRRLCKEFRDGGCIAYQAWLTPGAAAAWLPPGVECPPTKPSAELEKVALGAVLRALNRIPAYEPAFTSREQFPGLTPAQLRELNEGALAPDQRQALEKIRLQVIRLAQDRLSVLESRSPTADEAGVPPQWEGDDWQGLDRQVRRLLRYMYGREEADLQELCQAVWSEDSADVSESARQTTTSKANNFLRKRESPRLLRKVRGENLLRWK